MYIPLSKNYAEQHEREYMEQVNPRLESPSCGPLLPAGPGQGPEPQVLPRSPAGDFVNFEVESIRHEYIAGPGHAAPARDLGRVCFTVQRGEGVQAGAGPGAGNLISICLNEMEEVDPVFKQWLAICLGIL